MAKATYVGFGFGAIQAGLFLYEAYRTGAFKRLVVAEVVPQTVERLRRAGGMFHLNIAYQDHIESVEIGPVEILNPEDPHDRQLLIDAIAQASEIGTAIPRVDFFKTASQGSIHRILAQGIELKFKTDGPGVIVYTAENNNHAAEILESAVNEELGIDKATDKICYLNTVVGKMCGVHQDIDLIQRAGLKHVNDGDSRAFLVEAFNRILIDAIPNSIFERHISAFEEKPDLLPFEEAKLYGHNATHALAAYLAILAGVESIAQLNQIEGAVEFITQAFIQESGGALIQKYEAFDPLFTQEGWKAYVDDLIPRMMNPFLLDTAERVGRDPSRKLAWNDRLIGTMRLAIEYGMNPQRYALGAAAAIMLIEEGRLEVAQSREEIIERMIFGNSSKSRSCHFADDFESGRSGIDEQVAVKQSLEAALNQLDQWRQRRFKNLAACIKERN